MFHIDNSYFFSASIGSHITNKLDLRRLLPLLTRLNLVIFYLHKTYCIRYKAFMKVFYSKRKKVKRKTEIAANVRGPVRSLFEFHWITVCQDTRNMPNKFNSMLRSSDHWLEVHKLMLLSVKIRLIMPLWETRKENTRAQIHFLKILHLVLLQSNYVQWFLNVNLRTAWMSCLQDDLTKLTFYCKNL